MKKLLTTIVLISGICSIAFSQPSKRHNKGIESIKGLNLTNDQLDKLKQIREGYNKDASALKAKYEDGIKGVLSAEQYEVYKKSTTMHKGPKDVNEKLQALETEYQKQKTAIELSRIAPEMQKMKLEALKTNYDAKKAEVRRKAGITPGIVAVNPIAPLVLFDDVTKNRLEGIDANYNKAKKSIEMSRVAPEEQKRRLAELETEVGKQRDIVISADPNVLNSSEDYLKKIPLNAEAKEKLQKINEDYAQKRKAIEMTRIAPEMQKKRIDELNEATSIERETLIKSVAPSANLIKPLSEELVKFDEITQNKLELVGLEYQKNKKAIEMSRIAPEMQKTRLADLEKSTSSLREKVMAADPNLISSGLKIPGCNLSLDKAAVAELKTLNKTFDKAKSTILKTRIAPEVQERKIRELKQEYGDKRIAIVEKFLK